MKTAQQILVEIQNKLNNDEEDFSLLKFIAAEFHELFKDKCSIQEIEQSTGQKLDEWLSDVTIILQSCLVDIELLKRAYVKESRETNKEKE